MNTKTIENADEKTFEELLVGRSIVKANKKTIELDSGVKLKIVDHGMCCAYFSGVFKLLDFDQNVITSIERVNTPLTRKQSEEIKHNRTEDIAVAIYWKLNIYSANKKIGIVNLETEHGTGYYGTSINLEVVES